MAADDKIAITRREGMLMMYALYEAIENAESFVDSISGQAGDEWSAKRDGYVRIIKDMRKFRKSLAKRMNVRPIVHPAENIRFKRVSSIKTLQKIAQGPDQEFKIINKAGPAK